MICFGEAGERDIASRIDRDDRGDRSDRGEPVRGPDAFATLAAPTEVAAGRYDPFTKTIACPRAPYVREVSIAVTLYRSGTRAVLVPKETAFEHVPAYVRHWLGRIDQTQETSINEHTPMIGSSAAAVIYDLLTHGFCVIEPADPA